ncbi:MAG: biopolymer transporter ExbD [Gammaproteobacteria bacterium]|nr:biopolymer transporter ExbD [Gammaproteobacteria bacterium]NIQ09026.1 biopolymer transporter ExbD [Gammaproteobacteria bacterium]NIY20342.1 biopolymer transporter ExbD [Gammaproteobacteria bacterium]
MSFLRKPSEEPRIDLTPMVDVVFLLLIFFMISTTFVESPGISIKLPESSSQTIDLEPKELKIYLSQKGDIFYRDRQISLDEYKSLLAEHQAEAENTTVLLLADQESRHGKVVTLMDLARDAGFFKLAIATEQKQK